MKSDQQGRFKGWYRINTEKDARAETINVNQLGSKVSQQVPYLPPYSNQLVQLSFNQSGVKRKAKYECSLEFRFPREHRIIFSRNNNEFVTILRRPPIRFVAKASAPPM